jgi:hypothetical protein
MKRAVPTLRFSIRKPRFPQAGLSPFKGQVPPQPPRMRLMRKDPLIRENFTKRAGMDRDRNRSHTARMHRDAKEVLVGLASLLVFGVALVVWPPLGV